MYWSNKNVPLFVLVPTHFFGIPFPLCNTSVSNYLAFMVYAFYLSTYNITYCQRKIRFKLLGFYELIRERAIHQKMMHTFFKISKLSRQWIMLLPHLCDEGLPLLSICEKPRFPVMSMIYITMLFHSIPE